MKAIMKNVMSFAGEEKRCWSERRLAQRTARRLNETQHQTTGPGGLKKSASSGETFIPECNEDGRFAEIQVHSHTKILLIDSTIAHTFGGE
jgi:hypothetical protein